MSNLNTENQVIEGVGFYYTKIQKSVLKYQSQTEKEFVVDVHVDKATAKAWNKEFAKNKAKEMVYDDFVEKFGAENAIGSEEQFFIKLKKRSNYTDKVTQELKDIPDAFRPRVLLGDGNGELEDVTFTKLVGNGSKGVVQYEVNENSFGKFSNLVAIKVDELVEVEKSESTGKFNVLGKVKSLAESPVAPTVVAVRHEDKVSEDLSDNEW